MSDQAILEGGNPDATRTTGLWYGDAVVVLILLVAAVLRLAPYLARVSLWLDEAMIALNIASRSYLGLLRPLDYDQVAPVPFLWAERLMLQLGGTNELALRALPVIAGILLPFALWPVARRLLRRDAAILAVAFAAFSPLLIHFSNEVKPYSLDALTAVVLIRLALDVVDRARPTAWRRLAIGGVVAVCVSATAIFVLAGIIGAIATAPMLRHRNGNTRRLALAAAAWVAVFGMTYLAFYRPSMRSSYMQIVWEGAFLSPGTPHLVRLAWNIVSQIVMQAFVTQHEITSPVWPGLVTAGVLLLALIGLVALARSWGGWAAFLVAGPIAAVVAASVLHRYPIASRTTLFIPPLLMVMLAAGLVAVTSILSRKFPRLNLFLFGFFCLTPAAVGDLQGAIRPRRFEDVRPLVREFIQRHHAGEPVYIFSRAVPAWTFYTTNWSSPDTMRLIRLARLTSSTGPAFRNAAGRGHPVIHEGESYVSAVGDRSELIGLPSGVQIQWSRLSQPAPDSGWGDNETERILQTGHTTAWIFIAHSQPSEVSALLTAVERRGGIRDYVRQVSGARIYHYRFPMNRPEVSEMPTPLESDDIRAAIRPGPDKLLAARPPVH